MSRRQCTACIAICLGVALACASMAPLAPPGRSAVEGRVRLVPREGVERHGAGNAYGDRRLRDARRVDYDRPGFAVVYIDYVDADDDPSALAGHEPVELAAPPLQLKIRSGTLGPRIEPAEAALRRGHTIELMNATDARHVVSMPAEDAVHGLDPGAVVQISLAQPGPHRIYLLDVASAESLVFAAPGRFTVPRPTGEYALADLAPGAARVHVWHPRFPPSSSAVELRADTITPLDLVLGVGLGGPRTDSTGAGR